MFRFVVSFCICAALTPYVVNALTDEQKAKVHEHFEKVGLSCLKDNPITEDDITNLRAKKIPTGPNGSCFIACMMKDIGVMNEQGKLQNEKVLELAETVFKIPEELQAIENFLHSCAHINDEAVGDGDKGCERALSAYKCMNENAAKFGFDI